jgi:hypothetical protein
MSLPYNSNYDLTRPFSDDVAQVNLTVGGGVETYTVPGLVTDRYSVRFTYASDSNVFVCLNADPTIPGAASVGVQQYNEFKPGGDCTQRYVKGTDTIRMATPDASAYVGLSLMKVA